jgi:putative RecB family exonuclease
VLERLFDLPAAERTPQHAATMVVPTWEEMVEAEPGLGAMFAEGGAEITSWLTSCREVLDRYFSLEDPRLLEPAERELYVETLTDTKLLLRGVIDRVDVADDGAIRVVDYKTSASPAEMFEVKALFQLKFYALVIWRTRGVLPAMLQLIYLGNSEVLRYVPDEQDLLATERKVQAVWDAVRRARETGDWQPNPGFACKFCSHQALCPAYGGTPPPVPDQRSTAGPGPSAPSG